MSRTKVEYSWEAFEVRRRAINDLIESDTPRSMTQRDPSAPVPISVLDDMPYVELHMRSNYSLLKGASAIDELLVTARQQGHRVLTDHEAMYGSMEFARSAKEEGLRPITGLELTIDDDDGTRHHVTLPAESCDGYSNLCRLSSEAFGLHNGTEEQRETRRLDPIVQPVFLQDHIAGIVLLTGCRERLVPKLVRRGHLEAAEDSAAALGGVVRP